MIELKGLSKHFDEVKAVDSLTVNIEDGITGLVGENGAGKSTLLRLISDVIYPDSGSIEIDGFSSSSVEAKKILFFLDDDPYAPNGSTVKGIYDFYSCFYNIDPNKYNSLIKKFGLPTNQKVSTFSKGMKRQAFMALSLSVNVKYLLLDEAFDGLDPLVLSAIKSELISESNASKNVLISSHNISALERLVDRTIILYKGKLAGNQSTSHIGEEFIKYQACFNIPVNEGTIEELGIKVISFKKVGSICQMVIVSSPEAERNIKEKLKPILFEKVPIDPDEAVMITMLAARKGEDHE